MVGDETAGAASWAGVLAVGAGTLCYVGALSDAVGHHHVATQLVRAWSGTFELTDRRGRRAITQMAVIPSGQEHSIRVPGPVVEGALVFLDPSVAIASPAAPFDGDSDDVNRWVASGRRLGEVIDPADRDPALILQRLIAGIGAKPGPQRQWHPSVSAAVDLIGRTLPDPVTVSAIADAVCLSPSRLSRLFNDQVGQSIPTYVRWKRLRLAVGALQRGASLTDAAHAAGFTDSAHANRVCREMFGLSPSRASRNLTWS